MFVIIQRYSQLWIQNSWNVVIDHLFDAMYFSNFKFQPENIISQKKLSSEETFTKLMSIVQNVPGMSCEPIENDQSSHN